MGDRDGGAHGPEAGTTAGDPRYQRSLLGSCGPRPAGEGKVSLIREANHQGATAPRGGGSERGDCRHA